MANYYDWNPRDDKPKDEPPAVESNNQSESVPIPPLEHENPAVPVESLSGEVDTNPWASEDYISTPPTLLDDLVTEDAVVSEPIDVDDELHPMYRIVSAMMDEDAPVVADEQISTPVDEVAVEESTTIEVEGLAEGVSPTKLKNDELPDANFPPIPTRIDELTQAIERYPQSPVNYVLRGEAHWDEGHGLEAARDFLAALRLAGDRETTWEFLNRSILDRARQGLRRCGYSSYAEY